MTTTTAAAPAVGSPPRSWRPGSRNSRDAAGSALLDLVRLDGGPVPVMPACEWDRVAALALREQLSPLVLAAVRERGNEAAPPMARRTLERACARSSTHALRAFHQLDTVVRHFRTAGVEVALIKGAALARFVYANPALRPFHDLDLLIASCDRGAADRALHEAGYVAAPVGDDRAADLLGEQVYWDPSWRRVPIDLHWRLDASPVYLGLDCSPLIQRSRIDVLETEPVRILTPADTIAALTAHFMKHWWWGQPRLRYLRDIAEVARRSNIDWEYVVRLPVAAPMLRSPLRVVLSAAKQLTGAAVPGDLFDALAPSRGIWLDRYLRGRICRYILRERDWPLAVLLQVALLRWIDRDRWDTYPKLTAWVAGSRFAGGRRHRGRAYPEAPGWLRASGTRPARR